MPCRHRNAQLCPLRTRSQDIAPAPIITATLAMASLGLGAAPTIAALPKPRLRVLLGKQVIQSIGVGL